MHNVTYIYVISGDIVGDINMMMHVDEHKKHIDVLDAAHLKACSRRQIDRSLNFIFLQIYDNTMHNVTYIYVISGDIVGDINIMMHVDEHQNHIDVLDASHLKACSRRQIDRSLNFIYGLIVRVSVDNNTINTFTLQRVRLQHTAAMFGFDLLYLVRVYILLIYTRSQELADLHVHNLRDKLGDPLKQDRVRFQEDGRYPKTQLAVYGQDQFAFVVNEIVDDIVEHVTKMEGDGVWKGMFCKSSFHRADTTRRTVEAVLNSLSMPDGTRLVNCQGFSLSHVNGKNEGIHTIERSLQWMTPWAIMPFTKAYDKYAEETVKQAPEATASFDCIWTNRDKIQTYLDGFVWDHTDHTWRRPAVAAPPVDPPIVEPAEVHSVKSTLQALWDNRKRSVSQAHKLS